MFSERPLEGMPGLPFATSGLFFIVLVFGMTFPLCPISTFAQKTTTTETQATTARQQTLKPLSMEERIAGMPQDSMFTGSASRYEINDITFVGNTAFSSELLSAVITSRPSEAGIGRRIAGYIRRELQRNPASPKQLQAVLAKIEKNTDDNIRYFDKIAAGADTTALANYYRRNGFHRVQADYAFIRNPQTRRNALIFRIVENEPTPLDTIAYYGLEAIAADLAPKLSAAQTLPHGTRFNQSAVTEQNERILAMLRDNGYHSARYRKPILSFIEEENRDSATVVFDLGKRKRISSVTYVDSSASYTYLSPSVPQAFVEFKVDDWYSEAAVVRSVNNLYNFGLFDLALIDTIGGVQTTDSTIALRVLTRTRRIHSTDIGTFIGQIANTSLLEMGANARYENKNLFGSAQTLSLQAQIALVDVNTFVNNLLAGNLVNARLEGLLSARFAYPFFTKFLGRRVDLESRVSVSLQSLAFVSLAAPLLLETEKLYASLPMVLPQNDLFNNFFLEINLDRQRPINFDATQTQALALAKTMTDSTIVFQQLLQYSLLNRLYTGSTTPFLFTSTILTIGARGDHRDNLFNPQKGYFLDFSADAAVPPGASEFIRLSADVRWFESLSKHLVFAAKLRGGHTFLLNPDRTFVPIERHFFAGGSNSIRGWNVRDLRVRTAEQSSVLPELAFVGQFIGSGSLVEGSVEWRYSFATEPNEYGTFWEQQLSKIGVAGFVDMGNAFNSFLEATGSNSVQLSLADIAQNIAIAAGVGIRYNTSVGPFRVDLALRVYDPAKRQFFFQLPNPTVSTIIQNLFNVQIGLGHAF